ncbi:hypothetical protein K7432_000590 [Basidiobolus ranarum]|uniref:Uncharacterized protein n=1 Tax=Basidiobolus ranarum TaxID=34480 RepID=A0ABR2WB08_9FUNG
MNEQPEQSRFNLLENSEYNSFLSKLKPPQLKSQEVPNSFESNVEQLNDKSFQLLSTQKAPPSPPESVYDETDMELEEVSQTFFDHKTDKRVYEYHSKLRNRYNGMMNYLHKQTTTYWK